MPARPAPPARPASPPGRAVSPARVAVSAPALVTAGAGGALALVAGLPAVAVGAVVVAGWAVGAAAFAGYRRLTSRPIPAGPAGGPARPNPYAVPQPWRDLVSQVLQAWQRFAETARSAPDGPLRARLAALAERVDDGVQECWAIAQRGTALGQAVARLDPGEIRRRLALVEAEEGRAPGPDPSVRTRTQETAAALRSQLETVRRIEAVAEDARSRLELLAARLGTAVADAVELSVREGADTTALATSIDAVVGELATLRKAMAEADNAG